MKRLLLFLFVIVSVCSSQHQSPKYEVRAVWLTTAGSVDWPPKTASAAVQQQALVHIFDILQEKKFNTVFFQVRPRGNAFYRSAYEPWSAELSGTLGKNPGWDPLEFAVAEAHRRGMELHAWFNVAKVYGADVPPPSEPAHIIRLHPQWVKQYEGEWWIDMGNPEARVYTENVLLDLVHHYDIDGVHLDYCRYPGDRFDDWLSFQIWSDGIERGEWRRNNLTTFIREAYAKVIAEKPKLKFGSAPLGIYRSMPGATSSFTGYDGGFQDARLWLKEGIHDYVAPQIYWTFGEQKNPNDPDFGALCRDWIKERYNRHVYVGIGIYRSTILSEAEEQVDLVREIHADGHSYFRFDNLQSLQHLSTLYLNPALVPPMPWKDSIPPLVPLNISVMPLNSHAHILRWDPPPKAADGDLPERYVIYRSAGKTIDLNDSKNILAVLPATQHTFTDDHSADGIEYYYTVTALDRCWNESATSAPGPAQAPDFLNRYAAGRRLSVLAQNFPNPFNETTYIAYEIGRQGLVKITVRDSLTKMDRILVNEIQSAGIHIIHLDGIALSKGTHSYELRCGDDVIRKTLTKY